MQRRLLRIACALLLLAPLAGCWVFSELKSGQEKMEKYSAKHDDPKEEDQKAPAVAGKKGALDAYFKGEEEDGTTQTFSPGSVSKDIVGCKLGGSVQFMKKEDCAARGGHAG